MEMSLNGMYRLLLLAPFWISETRTIILSSDDIWSRLSPTGGGHPVHCRVSVVSLVFTSLEDSNILLVVITKNIYYYSEHRQNC